ncbi:MAG: hypothetical protein U9Q96_01725 [Patescibacteria group bacterium]|nr:hypothetical protein [Patescibacteria group bacterium]
MADLEREKEVAELTHDDLQERAEKLVALLKDREVGLFSWHLALNGSLQELYDLLCPIFGDKT